MKEGKDDDKATRPMFPRLHLKYSDKVGPRAPPRNKMALYEQLSIPSHGSCSTTLSPNKPGNTFPSTSSSQGGSHEGTSYPSFSQPHSRLIPSAEKPYFPSSDVKHMKTMESARRSTWVDYKYSFAAGSEDQVATLVQSTIAPHSNVASVLEANMPAPSGASIIPKFATLNSIIQFATSGKLSHAANSSRTILKAKEQIQGEQESGEAVVCKKQGLEFPIFSEAVEMLADPSENSLAATDRGSENNTRCAERKGYQSTRIEKESFHNGSVKVLRSFDAMETPESRIASKMRTRSCSGTLPENCHISYDDKENDFVHLKDTDSNNEVPGETMADLISGLDISPDDVVDVLGSKKFWKVRRAIVNQQRVFAIQVFELHRVIKVQKLFAASPHLLVDDSDRFKLQSKVVTESLPVASAIKLQQKIDSFQKPRRKAYSLDVKSEDSPLQMLERGPNKEPDQFPRGLSDSGNTPPITMTTDMPNPWCFQPQANNWLIPVMSPIGVIYKPFSGPNLPTAGLTAPLYGTCSPLQVPSLSDGFIYAAYGVPAPHQKQNVGVLPASLASALYGKLAANPVLSSSAVEQVSPLTSGKPGVQCSSSSCNKSITMIEALSGCAPKPNALNGSELLRNTMSSWHDEAREEGSNALAYFPFAPEAVGSCQLSQSSGGDHHDNVIKVVPQNRSSATESAARIYRSIQKERQQ